ncbi:DNA alkylation repair protein [Burkholderia gladioli]|uniref:DNA alkylation repair protein n=2 Tax=Burkholderia gladioli TaxID=28095 RepID=UPI001F2E1717|nr:DNA alkylation repair protein [Burkholderia gladioli]MCH7273282.1 DNA alkylation repair protein [Burkholderia gladioli]MDN7723241.1 DNA alkylation repair protein [Burkholderia gladioli]MDZ4038650.1 DNA alkylation repair protein [Burkholderia gladioli pv. alliicola]
MSTQAPDSPDSVDSPVLLKDSMGERQFRSLLSTLKLIERSFDTRRFLAVALDGLDELSLMARVRRASLAIEAGAQALPGGYDTVLTLLAEAAPHLGGGFLSLVAPDYVGQFGRHDFDRSMAALAFFTRFGSSEFAVREFLRDDPRRALATLRDWSRHEDQAVRRLASEGSRPRLPWSFRLREIEADPALAAPILDNLRADPSDYVRRSVANHLNDVTKLHPDWVLERAAAWGVADAGTRWIVRHALRTLVKRGDARALALLGASGAARIEAVPFAVTPARIELGETVTLAAELVSTAPDVQRLVVDYRIGYVKKNGSTAHKVFKLRELTLAPGQRIDIVRSQRIRDFTTRTHYAGRHGVELIVNGAVVAQAHFDLAC